MLGPQQQSAYDKVGRWLKSPDAPYFVLAGHAGSGKAQPLDAPVWTPNGPVAMGNLTVGDDIFGQDGQVHQVTGLHPRGILPAYRVAFRDGSSTLCSGDHLWSVQSAKDKQQCNPYRTLTTEQILEKGLRFPSGNTKWSIPLTAPVEFAPCHLEFDPYLIGSLIGNGSLAGPQIDLCTIDPEVAERAFADFPADDIRMRFCGTVPHYYIQGDSGRALREHLSHLGMRVKSLAKRIPQLYLQASIPERVALLEGLMDTDGSCNSGNRVQYSTSSAGLARDVQQLVQSLGGTAILYAQDRGGRYINTEYTVNVKVMFCPFHLARKAKNYRPSWKNPPSRSIVSITREGNTEMQCLSTSAPDRCYLTDDFIVTHNSFLASQIAKQVNGNVLYVAPTGKAANVLRQKGVPADRVSTIHKLIYTPKGEDKAGDRYRQQIKDLLDEENPTQAAEKALADARVMLARHQKANPLSFSFAGQLKTPPALIILDECSMVEGTIARDLISLGVPILAMGDNFQLPPVKGKSFFFEDKPDFQLTEVYRQALDSPVLRLATDVREGRYLALGKYGDSAVITRGEATEALALPTVQVLCGRNATRRTWNAAIRRKREVGPDLLNAGETLVCLRNDYELSVWNGALYTVTECGPPLYGRIDVALRPEGETDTVVTQVHVADLQGRGAEVFRSDRYDSVEVDYGYVLTTHKSQGSQWENVAVLDESGMFKGQADRWLYTAITRAEKTVTIVR